MPDEQSFPIAISNNRVTKIRGLKIKTSDLKGRIISTIKSPYKDENQYEDQNLVGSFMDMMFDNQNKSQKNFI